MVVKLFIQETLKPLIREQVGSKLGVEIYSSNLDDTELAKEIKKANVTHNDTVAFVTPRNTASKQDPFKKSSSHGVPRIVLESLNRAKATYLAIPDINLVTNHPVYTNDFEKLKPLPYRSNIGLTDLIHTNAIGSDLKQVKEKTVDAEFNNSVYLINSDAHSEQVLDFVDRVINLAKAG